MGAGASAGADASQHVSASGTADSKARVKQLHKMRQAARKKSLRNLKSAMQSLESPQEQLPKADASLTGFAGMKSFRSGAGQLNIGATWSKLPKSSSFSAAVAASAPASAMGSGADSQEDGKEEESSAGEEKSKDQRDRRESVGASKKIQSDVEVAHEGKENEEEREEKGGEEEINDNDDRKGDDENDGEGNESTENKVAKDGVSDMNEDQVESERELREAKEAQANATLDAALDRIAKERKSEKRPLKTVVDYSRPPLQDKFENRLWEDMLSYFQGLTEERPEAFWPWYNLAIAMDKRQRHSEAIHYYKGASNARLSRPDVVFRQGVLHVANDLKKASVGDPKLSGLEAYDLGSTGQARDGRFPQKTLVDEHDDGREVTENHNGDEEKERKVESKGKEDLDESKGILSFSRFLSWATPAAGKRLSLRSGPFFTDVKSIANLSNSCNPLSRRRGV